MSSGYRVNYFISLTLTGTGISFRVDIDGFATRIGEAWPTIGPFLPHIGLSVGVVGVIWLLLTLVRNIIRYRDRREKTNRTQILETLRLVAENAGIGGSVDVNPRNVELHSRVNLGMERLRELKLIPPNELSPKTLWIRLHHLIPIIETKGIKAAQVYCKKMAQDRK